MVYFRKKILFFYLVILPSVYIVMGFKLTTSSAEFSSCNHYTYLRLILFVNAVWTVLLTNNFQSVVVIPVGRAVASNSRGPRFKSSHWQNLYWTFYCQLYWKDENKEKEAGKGPFFKKSLHGGRTTLKFVHDIGFLLWVKNYQQWSLAELIFILQKMH